MPDVHAFLSASSSSRWLHCTRSAKLNARAPDQNSSFAQEGTNAHAYCAYLLEKGLGRKSRDPTEDLTYFNPEMQEAAEGYAAFVLEQAEDLKKTCPDTMVMVEQCLDYSRWVPEGFGTGDAVIVSDDVLHIIDMKYGVGVLVTASGEDGKSNTQLLCYALGALDTFGMLYDIKNVRLTIYQPRRENVDTFELSREELLAWAEEVLKPKASLAYEGKGDFEAGPWCRFCKVKATCRKRAEENLKLAQKDFEPPELLDNNEIAEILPQIDDLVTGADDVKKFALQEALKGKHFPGFKVVEGRSVRKYTDENAAAKAVSDAGYDPYEKKILGITAMTKELGKVRFNELLGGLVYKPPGKPVLVPDSDKRPEYSSAADDFNDNMEEQDYE